MAEEFKNVPEHQTLKEAMDESSATTGEVKDRGLFDFLGKKEEVKPQETPIQTDFDHKTQVSEPPAFVKNHEVEEEKENKPTLLEKLHQKHEEEEENKPSLLHKLHRSNSYSSSDEEGEDGEKKKKDKKKIVEGEVKTEGEKKGLMDKIKEKLPGHGIKPEAGVPVVNTAPMVAAQHPIEHQVNHPVEHQVKHPVEHQVNHPVEHQVNHPVEHQVNHPVEHQVNHPVEHQVNHPVEHQVNHPVEHQVEHPVEKKGIMEKIKEKLPGYHAKTSEEVEEKKAKESH